MDKTIKAKFRKGMLEPVEPLALEEGVEVTITITSPPKGEDALEVWMSTAGAWKGTHDPEELIRNIYLDRLISTRVEPKL